MAIFPWVVNRLLRKTAIKSNAAGPLSFHFCCFVSAYPFLIGIACPFSILKAYRKHIEIFQKQQMAFRYTVGAGRAYSSLLGLGKGAGTYALYFGALVPLRLCRAKACP